MTLIATGTNEEAARALLVLPAVTPLGEFDFTGGELQDHMLNEVAVEGKISTPITSTHVPHSISSTTRSARDAEALATTSVHVLTKDQETVYYQNLTTSWGFCH